MKALKFDYEGQPLRVLQGDDLSEWFLFQDVASILDLTPQSLDSLERKEKRTVKPFGEPDNPGKVVVSLSGLEKLIDIAKCKENSLLN